MQRYFIKNNQIIRNNVVITDGDYHHIKNVMRMKEKDQIFVCDEDENVYLSEIAIINNQEIILNILLKIEDQVELEVDVTIAFGLTRRDKQEEVARKITELGASEFIPVELERSVVKLSHQKESKLERLKLIVKEAAEQSHRCKMMKVNEAISFNDFLKMSNEYDLLLYAYEEEGRRYNYQFKQLLQNFHGRRILVLVGPEGGIGPKEVEMLNQNGFLAIGLGPRILRCETAPLYIMSAISYELELKNES